MVELNPANDGDEARREANNKLKGRAKYHLIRRRAKNRARTKKRDK